MAARRRRIAAAAFWMQPFSATQKDSINHFCYGGINLFASLILYCIAALKAIGIRPAMRIRILQWQPQHEARNDELINNIQLVETAPEEEEDDDCGNKRNPKGGLGYGAT